MMAIERNTMSSGSIIVACIQFFVNNNYYLFLYIDRYKYISINPFIELNNKQELLILTVFAPFEGETFLRNKHKFAFF